jgi:hypothetical protein
MSTLPYPIKLTITATGRTGIGKTAILRRVEAAINSLHLPATLVYMADHHQIILHVASPTPVKPCGVLPPKPTSIVNETPSPSNS